MLRIGEFARYLGVSVRMLRHYDALGLLVPDHVETASGHRRYSPDQLARGTRLVALREVGIGLDRIGPLLDTPEDPAGADLLRGALEARRVEARTRIGAEQAVLNRLTLLIQALDGGDTDVLEFTTKPLPELHLAAIGAQVDDQAQIGPAIGPLFGRLHQALATHGVAPAGPSVAWYEATDEGMSMAAAFPVALPALPAALTAQGVQFEVLPAYDRAVTVLHHGSMADIQLTWQALVQRVAHEGLTPTGRCREIYVHMPLDADPATWVTELQQPVA